MDCDKPSPPASTPAPPRPARHSQSPPGGRDVEGSKEDKEEERGDGNEEEEEDEEEWPRLPNGFPMPVPHLAADSIVASDIPIPWKEADVLIAVENGTIRAEGYE
uniref:Uncharacterized protein n=1 Tax=Chromera velia CCMP2878 TaxID=1169474 RepID=A0A0G4HGH1_9ALVE|eukprot:Cvel_6762.t1-p1 / transcript=Cvel_6762.t1 / gene=Cvel_6762 / organism=Chromera_velia_CCMP2878 / gene_product=hypothetical protein / transcript_product=hypothetical protein / location=Cvel_scaffold339:56344-56655(+) / protein_length=104 / sequence_SO=supercontig / SO=protein_coding / is_pseudo=false